MHLLSMFSGLIHITSCTCILFLFIVAYSIVWIYFILFIPSPTDGHLGLGHLLAITSNIAMNIHEQYFIDRFSIFLSIYLGVDLLGYVITH